MQENFSIYHPIINLVYFLTVIISSVIIMNPIFLGLSLICAFIYAVYLGGMKSLRFGLMLVLPLILLSVIFNPLVNHRGMTILFELPWNLGPVTLESVFYGLTTGLMIGAVIIWFVSFNIIITSDKLIYLFGRILPGSSLIFVMILRFIPRYREQVKKINEAQQAMGMGVNAGPLRKKIRNGVRILSIMFTWALENAIQTADSMRSRGYGLKNRTSFMVYKITLADKLLLLSMIVLICGMICAFASGYMKTAFFPVFEFGFSVQDHRSLIVMGSGMFCFSVLALIPVWLGIRESMYWERADKLEIQNGK